jgi:hypothetical protein
MTDRNQQRGTTVNRSRTIPPVGFFNECCNNIGATGDDRQYAKRLWLATLGGQFVPVAELVIKGEAESSELSGSAAGSRSGGERT